MKFLNWILGEPARTVGWRDPGFFHTSFLKDLWPNMVLVSSVPPFCSSQQASDTVLTSFCELQLYNSGTPTRWVTYYLMAHIFGAKHILFDHPHILDRIHYSAL